MSKTFEASRLSDGNKVFPCKVEIDTYGITVKIPGFLGGKEQSISFDQISSVKVDTPMVGYSKITIDSTGFDRVVAHGFTKDQVNEMKSLIQGGKSGRPIPAGGATGFQESEAVQLRKLELERERELQSKQDSKEFYQNVVKYWKIWVPIAAVLLGIYIYSGYSKDSTEKEAVQLNLQLEQLNDKIQVMVNNHEDRDKILEEVNKLVHPHHLYYSEKSKGFSSVYYDEYWNKIRQDYKDDLLSANYDKKAEPEKKKVVKPIVQEEPEEQVVAEEETEIDTLY